MKLRDELAAWRCLEWMDRRGKAGKPHDVADFTIHWALTAALILGPGDDDPGDVARLSHLHPFCRLLTLGVEVLDERETCFLSADTFRSDVGLLRHWCKLCANDPPAGEVCRLPDMETLREQIAFNRAYREHLKRQIIVGGDFRRRWELEEAAQETDGLYVLLMAMVSARAEGQLIAGRRRALAHWRDMIGCEAWHAGLLPPAVPWWRFQRVR